MEYLNEVAHILGRVKLNETANAKTASVARLLVECVPQHRDSLLAALQAQLNMYATECPQAGSYTLV